MLAPRPPHASRPPSRAALPPASTACHFFFNGGSTSRLLCAEPVAPTQIDENEHDGPHVSSESQVVITTDTFPIDSRALGVGWVARFGFPCYGPALRVGRTKKKSRGRARAIATTGALCSPALGEPDTYPAVSGGAGGMEIRKAPNGTAALSFVANSEAARYVFVVVAAADVMDRGRRYGTFVLACNAIAARDDDSADSMLGLAAAVGGCLSFAPAESEAAHTGSSGAGAAATPLMRASRPA